MSAAALDNAETLLEAAQNGERRALARLLTMAERGGGQARELVRVLHQEGSAGHTVGVTGAPGAGKSTLVGSLIEQARMGAQRVAVLAVDPSSPYSGGAILGDRVRLAEEHLADDGVFVRSLAARGHLGGLSRAVPDAVRVLRAAGWEWVVIETVGVGQSEVAVAGEADTTLVVVNPGWGDEIQANKAGLLEVADVLAVNKADREGAKQTVADLAGMLKLARHLTWKPPIVRTVALGGEGVPELWAAVLSHRDHLVSSGQLETRRSRQRLSHLHECLADELSDRVAELERSKQGRQVAEAVAAGTIDPLSGARQMLDGAF